MEDVLPGTLSPIAADGDGWVCAVDATIGKAACALPELAASATASIISIEATVLPGAYPEVTNTATVSSTTPELPGTLDDNTSTITDAPTIRSLKFALADEFEDWRDGEMMIQSLLRDEDDIARATAHQQKLETLIMKAGGITGPGSIGDAYDIGEG